MCSLIYKSPNQNLIESISWQRKRFSWGEDKCHGRCTRALSEIQLCHPTHIHGGHQAWNWEKSRGHIYCWQADRRYSINTGWCQICIVFFLNVKIQAKILNFQFNLNRTEQNKLNKPPSQSLSSTLFKLTLLCKLLWLSALSLTLGTNSERTNLLSIWFLTTHLLPHLDQCLLDQVVHACLINWKI